MMATKKSTAKKTTTAKKKSGAKKAAPAKRTSKARKATTRKTGTLHNVARSIGSTLGAIAKKTSKAVEVAKQALPGGASGEGPSES